MLTVTNISNKTLPTITTNDIPVGETFRGVLVSPAGTVTKGLWLKISGVVRLVQVDGSPTTGPCVLRLDDRNVFGNHSLYSKCTEVTDYEPVDVELVVHTKSGG